MVNLTLAHALYGTPETVGELLQMIDVLQAKVVNMLKESSPFGDPFIKTQAAMILKQLQQLEAMNQNVNPNSPPGNVNTIFQPEKGENEANSSCRLMEVYTKWIDVAQST